MADYWGLKAIAARLGLGSTNTLAVWHERYAFPMYLRRKPKTLGLRWYTNDALIATYELARASQDRERHLRRQRATKTKPGRDSTS